MALQSQNWMCELKHFKRHSSARGSAKCYTNAKRQFTKMARLAAKKEVRDGQA